MATANPAMNEAVYQRAGFADSSTSVMTIDGTVLKTAILMVILVAGAVCTWSPGVSASPAAPGLMMLGFLGGLVTALITIFMPRFSPITAPIYAGLEGLCWAAFRASSRGGTPASRFRPSGSPSEFSP